VVIPSEARNPCSLYREANDSYRPLRGHPRSE
jgi:hypothetical protein